MQIFVAYLIIVVYGPENLK